jgi:DNA-binding IclR family transcriptional regulator
MAPADGQAGGPKVRAARKGIQSIEIGFAVLSALMTSSRPLPLKRISQLSGLPSSKVHSYLVSFTALEVVSQDPDTGHYGLGPFALKLGLGFLDQFDLFSATRPVMLDLAEEIGVTVYLGVWGNRGPTIIHKVDGSLSDAILDIRVGSVLPILRSALGRNLAAHLPAASIRQLIAQELAMHQPGQAHADTMDDPVSLPMAERMLEQVRRDGIARVRAGLLSDFSALSVPIFDHSGATYGALTMMGRYRNFDDSLDGAPALKLKAACAAISSACGYVPEQDAVQAAE